ncbi:unnamed protein product [Prorocentrum cordatum]|uniref:Protein kinase domain-containing protein n=1 Tax=Prorocentrum cordatum TaxID=2364126 RepID=A0ABN9USE6_9DINO|nr:unnamed protein product [Polarella glacialis]
MACDPPRRGPPLRQEDGEDGTARASSQAWLESRLRGLCQDSGSGEGSWLAYRNARTVGPCSKDDFGGGLRIFSSSDLEAPEAFRDVWHVISRGDVSNGAPLSSDEDSARLQTILVFCNPNQVSDVQRLCDVITNIDVTSSDAPPMFLVPHSVAPDKRGRTDVMRADQVNDILTRGLDGIVSGEPEGLRLAMAVRMKICKSANIPRKLNAMLTEARNRGQHGQYMQRCAHATLWDYVRARLAPDIPAVDHTLAPGDPQQVPGYIVGNKLGQGTFGAVYKLTERPETGSSVEVVKAVPTEGITRIEDLMHMNRMIRVMNMLSDEQRRHPNIIRLHRTYHTPTHILFRMEYGGPENLYKRLRDRQAQQAEDARPLSLDKVATIITQAVDVVWHLHAVVHVCHRDIRPKKIMVNQTPESITIKFTDFDLAVSFEDEGKMLNSPCGTLPFVAPEMLLDSPYDGCLADIWSLGVVFAEVLCGVRVVELAIEHAGLQVRPLGVNTALAECIRTFFRMPAAVARLLEEHCRPELRPLQPLGGAVLAGTLTVDPAQRTDADGVRSMVEQGLAPLALGPAAPDR